MNSNNMEKKCVITNNRLNQFFRHVRLLNLYLPGQNFYVFGFNYRAEFASIMVYIALSQSYTLLLHKVIVPYTYIYIYTHTIVSCPCDTWLNQES